MAQQQFRKARSRIEVSAGESVRIIRELQELSQSGLSKKTGIPQSTISAIEHGRINLGVERAKVLARALKCHPAVLVFPGWELRAEEVSRVTAGRRGSARVDGGTKSADKADARR
jgi:transcriptional regulator with XRE-family HTH domain